MLIDELNQVNSKPYEQLQALYHMAVELSALHSLDSVLDMALCHCLDLTDSQFGFIGLTISGSKAMDVVAIQGFHPQNNFYEHHRLIPLRPNIFSRTVIENSPVRTVDAMTDPGRVGQPKGHPPVTTFLGVPLRIHGEPIGMIGVANRLEPYDDEHEQLLMTYAAQVAIAIRNTQLYEQLTVANEALEQKVALRTEQLEETKEALARKAIQLQQLLSETMNVQEHERQRIAQDMHDGTNQLLIGAILELKSAHKRLDNNDVAQAATSLKRVQKILHRVEAETKQIIHHLRPPTLDALGLAPAIRRYGERFQEFTNIPCNVSVLGTPIRFSSKIEISVYRLFQEALHNVSAHANANCINVVIKFAPEMLLLKVIDDGQGFDLKTVLQNNYGHLGLFGMQERAESLGGSLIIHTQPRQGTQIEVRVPAQVEEATD